MNELPQQHISRVFVLPLGMFEYMKKYQREMVSRTGQHHNNSQVLTQMLIDHLTHVGLTGKPREESKAALLLPRRNEVKEGQQ